tara:strand:+ start:4678 stop:5466 length:789 start_codon:yes stop_codon:yes gene_type:complete
MTDNSDDKAKALANITLFKDTKLYPRPRVLDVAATLLNLEPNGVAFFKSIRDANIARNVAYKINGSLLWDTDDDHFYFLTGHVIGADNELDLAVQRVNPASNTCSLVTSTGKRVPLTRKIMDKHRHYKRMEARRLQELEDKRQENIKAVRARIEKLRQERKRRELNRWYKNATPSERILYDNETLDLQKQISSLEEKLRNIKSSVHSQYTTSASSGITYHSTYSNASTVPITLSSAPPRNERDEILEQIKNLRRQVQARTPD